MEEEEDKQDFPGAHEEERGEGVEVWGSGLRRQEPPFLLLSILFAFLCSTAKFPIPNALTSA